MDMEALLAILVAQSPYVTLILQVLGALVVLGGIYVKMTPSEKDDAWYAALETQPIIGPVLKILVRFSPITRK